MREDALRRQQNRAERLATVLERDGYECVWCRGDVEFGLNRATTDHIIPRVKGGPSWIENEVAACRRCNGERGHTSPAEWIAECRRIGLDPNHEVIITTLLALRHRVEMEGGCRRMRPYLESQIRRLCR